jgi:DNA-binding MarR family transcriptional regulator
MRFGVVGVLRRLFSSAAEQMADEFPTELEQFLAQQIESLAELEALLLIRKQPEHQWNCDDMSRQLYITADMCAGLLAELERRGFLRRVPDTDGSYQYHPASPDLDRLLGELAALYQERRVAVITQIYSRPVKKVQTFADAFRLRREGT